MNSPAHLACIFLLAILISCDGSKFQETPTDNFIGTWELEGRSMFDGIQIEISKNESGEYSGKIIKLNDNKYVQMFATVNDTWVTAISRSSNFSFNLTERKIAAPLFSLYGQSSSNDFTVEFIDENTIGLASGSSNPVNSSIIYRRLN